MSKIEIDGLKRIEIWWLKKKKYLDGLRYGNLEWTQGCTQHKSSIGIIVSTLEKNSYIQLNYTITGADGKKRDFDYKHRLVTTPCNYGGKRYWFVCGLSVNGKYCGRRVGVLYMEDDYFGCRHCYNLTYESRNVSGFQKSFGKIISYPEFEKMETQLKRKFYKGNMTRRYKRYIYLRERNDAGFIQGVNRLTRKCKS